MTKKRELKPVLVIEDDPSIQNFASRVLELEGHQVLKANDAKTGIEMLRENAVALVLLALRLPGRNGWSVLREIKHDPELSTIPVVVLTAVAEAPPRRRTLKMGAADYLVKPLSANSLKYSITGILKKRGNH